MVLYFIELIALLIFWKFADFKRFRALIPILFTAAFLRFLEHYIVIDWCQLWIVRGSPIWTPLSANMTIWVFAAYLFIQYLPKKHRLIYGLGWALIMYTYLCIIKWAKVFSIRDHWHMSYSFLLICCFFATIYLVWSWLYPAKKEQDVGK